jgi:hypothetical protein
MNKEIFDYFNTLKKDKDNFYIVGRVEPLIVNSLEAKDDKVVISFVTIKKNILHHKDIGLDDYKKIAKVLLLLHQVINSIFDVVILLIIKADFYRLSQS